MADSPWAGDACSLVDAFRSGERSPLEELEATLAAIASSNLNAFSFLDPEPAIERAENADTSLPFGGVPVAVKELEHVAGWPATDASLVFANRKAAHTGTVVERLTRDGGANPFGMTTASEFGGLNVSVTKLNGVTHNPWQHGRTAGGSSAGSAAAVAGGLVSLATGGDGGGSIRIPAGYNGLLGMKGTYGRIPRGPHAYMRPNTVVLGCLARSVRDAARYYDVCAGYDARDPSSLPKAEASWEERLGSSDLRGKKVIVDPRLGDLAIDGRMETVIHTAADSLIRDAGLVRVPRRVEFPTLSAQWMMGNLATLLADLGDRWPSCAPDMTEEVAIGLFLSQSVYNLHTAAAAEALRVKANEAMADAFDEADFIITSTNPGPAFPATAVTSSAESSFLDWAKANQFAKRAFRAVLFGTRVGGSLAPRMPSKLLDFASGKFPDLVNMGALTIPANITGNPAVSIPVEPVDGLPIGMQVIGRHHEDALLFDLAQVVERERPWPLVAPAAPA
ncbi:MAG TPA: amidase [Acidimicrobiales bacterium]|nr:amidase [Acidimicrobiales bacterium]